MKYQQTQCLIFFRSHLYRRFHPKYGIIVHPAGSATGSGASGVSTRTVKAAALLPVAFCNSHQSVVSHFNKNEVHILRHGDELREDDKHVVCVVECFLEENLDDEADYLSMILPSDHYDLSCDDLNFVFDKSSVRYRQETTSAGTFTRSAIDDQNTEVFQRLVRHFNLLSVAIAKGLDWLVKLSLDHGADVNARCSFEPTPLFFAGSSKFVQLLIDEGASVHLTDCYGCTPLHLAKSLEVVKALLENGADLECENNAKKTPLLNQIRFVENLDVIKLLLDYGAHIDFKVDSNLGLLINNTHVSDTFDHDYVFEYVLTRCFGHVDFEYGNKRPKQSQFACLSRIFARHLARVVSLNLKDRYGFNAGDFWEEKQHGQPLSAYKEQCEIEVSRMKSKLIAGTDLSVYELLAKDEHQVARLLRNQSVTFDPDELKKMFPEYGLMLTCALEKGRNRFEWQEQAIVSCNLLSANFKRMPDEIKENIVNRLSIVDIRSVKKASVFLSCTEKKTSVSCTDGFSRPDFGMENITFGKPTVSVHLTEVRELQFRGLSSILSTSSEL